MSGYERLSVEDRLHLDLEDANIHTHIAAVFVLDGGPLLRDDGGVDIDRIRDLLDAPDVVRLGFGFEYDLSRLRRGYAGRLSSLERKDSDENQNVNEFGETGHALGTRVVDVKAPGFDLW